MTRSVENSTHTSGGLTFKKFKFITTSADIWTIKRQGLNHVWKGRTRGRAILETVCDVVINNTNVHILL